MIKVWITGVCGQVGSQLAEDCLKKGWLVVGLDNLSTGTLDNLSEYTKNHRDFVFIKDLIHFPTIKFDYVFHCAALANIVDSIKDPVQYFANNVAFTQAVLATAKDLKVKKFIYCASSSCYGDNAPLPTNEDAPIDCKYPYALSKYMGEELVLHYGKVYDLTVISFRIFNIYSPYIKGSVGYGSVLKTFARSWLELNNPILGGYTSEEKMYKKPLVMIGDGTQKRDFLHVKDCTRAMIMAAESDIQNEVFNLGANNPQSINYLIELMFGKDYPRNPQKPRPAEPLTTWADISKIEKKLGWKPEITFEDGVKEVMENIENYRNFPYFDVESYNRVHEDWYRYLGVK